MEYNAHVWARNDQGTWNKAIVTNTEHIKDKRVVTSDGAEKKYALTATQADEGEGTKDLKLQNVGGQSSFEEGASIDDLIVLTHLHEPAILYTLEERYNQNIIYTFTGPILIAINPFWPIPLYTNEILERYRLNGLNRIYSPSFISELPPHVYAIADRAYRLMVNPASKIQCQNQSILVSGESGAGKTETTKIIMRYLAILGGHDSKALMENDLNIVTIEKQVLQSNPILEAFGNARTVRNDNSSRFGKYIEIDFDKDGFLTGAAIRTFLLEKIRLVHTSFDERNFHIFYLMLNGTSLNMKKKWNIEQDLSFYFYTNQSNCYRRRDGILDSDLWVELNDAMHVMGITELEMEDIFKCCAGILNCGNIEFRDVHTSNSGEVIGEPVPSSLTNAQFAAAAWNIQLDTLISTISSRSITAGGETFVVHSSSDKCRNFRDALCKAIYSGIFTWLVEKINETIGKSRYGHIKIKNIEMISKASNSNECPFIGLLDIFGFESFDQNYFEQFLINYANEKLQQQFNHFIFEMEQAEYEREGIRWDFVEFPDNKVSIELIEGRPTGILSLLDEQCIVPKASDQTLAGNLYRHLSKNSCFKCSNEQRVNFRFVIQHYAGDIIYETEGFLEKNRDTLHDECLNLVQSSSNNFFKNLCNNNSSSDQVLTRKSSMHSAPSRGLPKKSSSNRSFSNRAGGISRLTVGAQFKNQLNNLLEVLSSTHPHYIRCLKPNDVNTRNQFDVARITNQLASGGVLEAVRVARAGFPVRMLHAEFISRYGMLFPGLITRIMPAIQQRCPVHSDQIKEICCTLILEFIPILRGAIPTNRSRKFGSDTETEKSSIMNITLFQEQCSIGGVQVGCTKVFFMQSAFNRAEQARTSHLEKLVTRVQALYRGYTKHRAYKIARTVAVVLQAHTRGIMARKLFRNMKKENAASKIQFFMRRNICERERRKLYKSAVTLQKTFLSYYYHRLFVQIKVNICIIQKYVKRWLAKNELKRLRQERIRQVKYKEEQRILEQKRKEQKAEEDQRRRAEEALSIAEALKAKRTSAIAAAALDAKLVEERREREILEFEERRAKALEDAENAAKKKLADAEMELTRSAKLSELAREKAFAEELRILLVAQESERTKLAEKHEQIKREALKNEAKKLEALRIQAAREEAARMQAVIEESKRIEEDRLAALKFEQEQIEFRRNQLLLEDYEMSTSALFRADSVSRSQRSPFAVFRSNSMSSMSIRRHDSGAETEVATRKITGALLSEDDNDYSCVYSHSGSSPKSQYPESLSDCLLESDDLTKMSIGIDKAYVSQLSRNSVPYVAYRIVVKTDKRKWSVERCFQDFISLHQSLVDALPTDDLPQLPSKTIFGDKLNRDFIEDRRMQLQNYLVGLLAENGHWLAEQYVHRVEVGTDFSRNKMKEMIAKQSFIAFLDPREPSLRRDDDTVLSTIATLFRWSG